MRNPMSDPYFDIDIPRVLSSAEAAIRRTRSFTSSLSFHKSFHEKHPEPDQKPFDEQTLFPFRPSDVGRFLRFIEGLAGARADKANLRKAVHILIGLLDPCSCWISHCKHNHGSAAMNCMDGKNPRRCPKAAQYRAKKEANHEECAACSLRETRAYSGKRSFHQGHLCMARRNADRPANCPKVTSK